MPSLAFRLIDANLNRASEGLRVLEDVARFVLNDQTHSLECKRARHDLARIAMAKDISLLTERDSAADVGREAPAATGGNARDLVSVVRANAKRAEESLRVIEELSRGKTQGIDFDAAQIERIRYNTYELEKRIAAGLMRSDSRGRVRGLYAIIDRQVLRDRDLVRVAREAIEGGAAVIQQRDKLGGRRDTYRDAAALRELCREHGVLFVVNDAVDIAVAVGAPAVHVGQGDLPLEAVRKIVPMTTIVGVSCHSFDDVERALGEGADYIAVGSVYPTSQKENAVVVGLDLVRRARQRIGHTPLVAIGGIDRYTITDVMSAGADAVAVVSAVAGQDDVTGAARELCAAMDLQERNRDS
ncbi:MAG: thiamine phosphate synthase [Chloroflexota bacterium]